MAEEKKAAKAAAPQVQAESSELVRKRTPGTAKEVIIPREVTVKDYGESLQVTYPDGSSAKFTAEQFKEKFTDYQAEKTEYVSA